jgi:hypothetical protein
LKDVGFSTSFFIAGKIQYEENRADELLDSITDYLFVEIIEMVK